MFTSCSFPVLFPSAGKVPAFTAALQYMQWESSGVTRLQAAQQRLVPFSLGLCT